MSDRPEYFPVDGGSLGADDTAQSLLSQDEKGYVFRGRRPAYRHFNRALKAIFLLLVLVLHAGLIVFLARWLLPTSSTFSDSFDSLRADVLSSLDIKGQHNGDTSQLENGNYRVHTLEGSPHDSYKNPNAEFLQIDPCGRTAAEARARGCRFGLLYGAWLPEACYDQESEENFKNHSDWKFYLQPNRTEEISWDEASKGEHDYMLVEWEYHQRHCAEMNRRLFTAISRRGLDTIDSYLSQWNHTDHCAHAALVQKPFHELAGILWRKFPDCGLIRWKN